MMFYELSIFAWIIAFSAANPVFPRWPTHPAGLVDLGYAKHVPTFINTTATGKKVAIYKNIRFANPPTGDLRFRKPDTDLPKTEGIQDGNVPWASLDCISSAPPGSPFAGMNGTTWGHEDCLFLDVYVPEGVKPWDKVPVLHYLFGSAFAFGSKDVLFNPLGLFDLANKDEKFIFVTNNYRLGMPGWTYSDGEAMDANVGIFDCLAALEWVSKYVGRFGGNGKRITAAAQSAGSGILYYMLTLNGGKGKLPFQRAFMSSPDAPPRRDVKARQADMFKIILDAVNCTSLECLRSVPEEAMLLANDKLINQMIPEGGGGVFGPVLGFGPAPDDKEFRDIPLALLQRGSFHKEIDELILGNMVNEGMGLSDDYDMPARFPVVVRMLMPTASNETIADIQSNYQPLVPNQLAWDWTTDVIFACNAYNLATALPKKSKRYIMSQPPGIHGQDLYHFFYNDMETTPVPNVALAKEFQSHLLKLVHGKRLDWPAYGRKETLYNITDTAFVATDLPKDLKKRCDTIAKAVLDPANGV
ncbi:Alpha/Beta hydrolase protein [Xylariaceae sp. FL0662B]|nr:Alpha/Beta hydrolase protein [Xylariaceae sp. FL0662B]